MDWDKNSIVDFLKQRSLTSHKNYRAKLYKILVSENTSYTGTELQNVMLLRKLKTILK